MSTRNPFARTSPVKGLKLAVQQDQPRQPDDVAVMLIEPVEADLRHVSPPEFEQSETFSRIAAIRPSPRRASDDRRVMRPSRAAAAFTSRFARMSSVNSSKRSSTGRGMPYLRRICSSKRSRPRTVCSASSSERYPRRSPRENALRAAAWIKCEMPSTSGSALVLFEIEQFLPEFVACSWRSRPVKATATFRS